MMRFVTKPRPINSIKYLKNQGFEIFTFSTKSKYNKNHSKSAKTQKTVPDKPKFLKRDANDSLFSDITEIIGTVNLDFDKNLPRVSVSGANGGDFGGGGHCTPGVRGNAKEKTEGERGELLLKGVTQVRNLGGNYVSGIVRRITEIVRGDHGEVSMEERLDESGYELSSDIVGKVLKRCFKVPHLAKRFFDWVKLKNERCLSTENYNTMLYMAGDRKDFELVERLVEEMEEYNCEKDIKTWTIILVHYGKAKMVGKALSLFEKMRKSGIELDVEAYRILIQILCQFRKGEIALEFYKEMVQKGFELHSWLYPQLLKCLADCGDVDGVYLVVDDMISVSHIPENDAYCSALKSLCISGRIKEALELIRDLNHKNVTLSPLFFETLVKGLCRANRVEDALEMVDIMKKRNVVSEGVYGALINGYLRKNDASKALDLFHDMKETGFTPLTSTYTELMQHHFNSNDYEKGCALYSELLETGVELDTVAYTAMIAGHVRHDHIEAAWKVFQSMEKEGIKPTQKCFLIFIKELCRSSSRANEITKLLTYMLDSKINIGKEIYDCVRSYLVRNKKIANSEHIKDLLRRGRNCRDIRASQDTSSPGKMQNGGSDSVDSNADLLLLEPLPLTYSDEHLRKVCAILSSANDWPAMEEALEKLSICYTPVLVSEILHKCSQHGSAVLHFFAWVRNQPGYRHTTETYNSAIKIAGKGKDFIHMRNIFNEMRRNGCLVTPDTWTIMIMLYGRIGLTDIATRTFSEMKASGCKPTTSTYKYLMLSLCGRKGRKVEEAVQLFSEMINAGFVPDKEVVEVCFDCFCQAGKLEEAKKCLKHLQKVGFSTPLSYSLLIRSLCRTGQLEDALALVSDIQEVHRPTLDHYVSASLVHGLLKKGRLDEALSKINSLKEAGIHPTVHIYTSLISHFCKAKDIDRALEIFKTMGEEGCQPTVVTYTALIDGYIRTGNFEDARKLFLKMRFKGPFPDFKAYSVVIGSFCEAGQSEVAMECLSEMLKDGIVPSTINFRTVYYGLNREGKHDLARTVMHLKHNVCSKRKFLTT
ncbi:putative pentatricopeptide repeat-containing protein At5g06400, mitochondrial [Silene latifolia]|uniref:putative pentatricopeptide repeat-containing protein At5g06400, mitochondrial n=1 Tax=Silene latifolia TaxID=37657 RepID=UPI003D774F1A